jgi:phosphoribosylglycinamide formyltransferase-1
MTPETAPLRVTVLASGSGSNLQALLDDQQGYRIVQIITDRQSTGALARAQAASVPALAIPLAHPRDPAKRSHWEHEVVAAIVASAPDLIVMAGWMRVMSPSFVHRFADRLINQHPALLPDDASSEYVLQNGQTIPAIRGAHAVRDALNLRVPVTGCTVHWVTPEVDVGHTLARAEVPVTPDDDEATLHERIKAEERRMIVAVVRKLAAERRWSQGMQ